MGAGVVSGRSRILSSQDFSSAPPGSSATPSASRPLIGAAPLEQSELLGKPSVNTAMSNKATSCDACDVVFSLFKRRKFCRDCRRYFCSSCLPKPSANHGRNGRQCTKCNILISGRFTRQMLQAWKIKDMRGFLNARNIPTSSCKEKHDLIDLLLVHFSVESNSRLLEQAEHDRRVGELADRMRSSSFYRSTPLPNQVPDEEESSSTTSGFTDTPSDSSSPPLHQTTSSESHHSRDIEDITEETEPGDDETDSGLRNLQETQEEELRETFRRLQEELRQEEPEARPGIRRTTLEDVKSEADVERLTVRQLKEILVNNFVDYRGCCEKQELTERVRRLWKENQANKLRATAMQEESNTDVRSAKIGTMPGEPLDLERDICKICMDASIDCILLECGHMVTCAKCGKRLADCPICRQYITRVVHIFRS